MSQTKDQKRRNAIDLKRDAIEHWRRQIKRLKALADSPHNDWGDELLAAYDRDVEGHRQSLVEHAEQKIRAHERDIINTEAKLGFQT